MIMEIYISSMFIFLLVVVVGCRKQQGSWEMEIKQAWCIDIAVLYKLHLLLLKQETFSTVCLEWKEFPL